MKYLKTYEESSYINIFPSREPDTVPGFEDGTINPEDTEPWETIDGEIHEAESVLYNRDFLKIVKERNFKEIGDKLYINLEGIGQDYCMSIYEYPKHLKKFLNDEIKGKYVEDGFKDIINDKKIEGIIESVTLEYVNDYKCSVIFGLKLEGIKYNDEFMCLDVIVINKFKSTANKYNL